MQLKLYSRHQIDRLIKHRENEIRLGEKVEAAEGRTLEEALEKSTARFVIFGLPEDIGVRANFGRGGAYSAWQPALSTILNLQSNEALTGEQIQVLGNIDFSDEMDEVKDFNFQDENDLKKAREIVSRIDEFVYPVIKTIIASGKDLIIIGGGHNNSYPVIRGTAEGLKQAGKISDKGIHSINLDAHSDLRPLEGRHSGNGFSYAINDGYLKRYAVVGLQEIFNPGFVFQKLEKHHDKIRVFTFDDIYIHCRFGFDEAVKRAIGFLKDSYTGIEIDMDTIQNIPSSAKTSCGVSTIEARRYINQVASACRAVYLHIAEAAPVLSHIKTDLKTGKLIAYLVTDYIKARVQYETTH
ncbi:MAG: formimidoylglutamase [Bacteroidia bacterium]|nr:formimidoylglutamase [Bacteroidia bacterium]MCZ2276333.1 formimidoylglutamase [Bacteroidia bacterium]